MINRDCNPESRNPGRLCPNPRILGLEKLEKFVKIALFRALNGKNNNSGGLIDEIFMCARVLILSVHCNLCFDNYSHSLYCSDIFSVWSIQHLMHKISFLYIPK